jgi:uncharacterized protein (TIGR02246 family)
MTRMLLLVAFALTLSAPAQETAIRALMDQQTADWNRGDIDAFMSCYEDSPQTTFVGQKVEYGYANILARYKRLYATRDAMGKLAFSNLAIRVLDSDYAVTTGNFHLDRTAAAGGNADGIFSLILKKDPQGWKIILDHTSRTN